jgi:lipoprotein NlpD
MSRLLLSRILCVSLGVLLGACTARYPAPVADLDETPRFIDSGRTHRVNAGETLVVVAWIYELDVAALARANNLSVSSTLTPGQILSVDLRGQPSTSRPAAVGAVTTTGAAVSTGIRRTPLESAPITRQSLPQSTPLPQNTTPEPATTTPPPAPRTETPPPVARAETAPVTRAEVPPPVAAPPVTTEPAITAPSTPPAAVATLDPNAPVVWAWPARGNIIGRFSDSDPDDKGIKLGGSEGDTVMAAADGEVVYTGNGLLRYGELVIVKHNDRFLSAYAHNKVIMVKEGDRVTRGQKIAELGSTGIDRDMLHFEIRLDGKPVDPLQYLPSR